MTGCGYYSINMHFIIKICSHLPMLQDDFIRHSLRRAGTIPSMCYYKFSEVNCRGGETSNNQVLVL